MNRAKKGGGTCCVDMVSRVVTPSETRAGTAFGSSQKLTCGKGWSTPTKESRWKD
jgi:hypothetical protein